MDFFFNPKGIALIGATPNPQKGGHAILRNLRIGYKDKIFPVNPSYAEIEGMQCYPSVMEIPDPVDLAIIFVPAPLVSQIVQDCAGKKIPGVMIESGGFAETGDAGSGFQKELTAIAKETGIRIWGPNCMGLVDTVAGHVFSFVSPSIWDNGLKKGSVSMIVQSGMLSGVFIADLMTHGIMGVSKVCSIGNKVDVDECEILEYLLNDPKTNTIALYLESVSDGRRFYRICKHAEKPIVVLKGGKSAYGASAALSHTAGLCGNNAVISGALAQAGVIEAKDFMQWADIARSLSHYPNASSKNRARVAVVSYSGAAGIVSADFLSSFGLEIAELSSGTLYALKTVSPSWMPVSNPVDLWPAVERNGARKAYGTAIRALCADSGVDGILVHAFAGNFALNFDLSELAHTAEAADKPMICWLLGERQEAGIFQEKCHSQGILVFRELFRAVECMAAVLQKQQPLKLTEETPLPIESSPERLDQMLQKQQGVLDEYLSKQVLSTYGIPGVPEKLVFNETDVLPAVSEIGYPVVMKGIAKDIVHKSDKGLIRMGLHSEKDIFAAVSALSEIMNNENQPAAYLIQRQLETSVELIAGMVRDPQFGPCVMCGFGGIFAEILKDSVFAPAPLSRADALKLIGRLKSAELLEGYRGLPPVDRTDLAEILMRLGQLGTDYPRISEIDINPLMVYDQKLVAVDATIVLTKDQDRSS